MSYDSIIDIFEERVKASPEKVALRFYRDGESRSWTWKDCHQEVCAISAQLQSMGVRSGDRVGILSENRPEWVVVDLAIMYMGAVSVPIYPATLARHCQWMLERSDADWLVIEDPLQLEKVFEVPEHLKSLRGCLMIDEQTTLERPDRFGRMDILFDELEVPQWLDELITWYEPAFDSDECGDRYPTSAEELASIVFTSGTTGAPRGVMLSHQNFVAEALGNAEVMPIEEEDRQILLLPLSQIFARILYMTSIYMGAEISFSAGFSHLIAEFQREKPTFFVGVPSVFERLGARFAVDAAGGSIFGKRRSRMTRFSNSAIERSRQLQGRSKMGLVDQILCTIGDYTMFRRLHEVFGGRLRFAICGGAPLSQSVCEMFHGAGIPIYEGYGLTESCGAATVNSPEAFLSGTVGKPLPGVEVKLDKRDQILLRGPSIASKYWDDPEANRENFDDGWLCTGDVGCFVDEMGTPVSDRVFTGDEYLRVVDRLDDRIVLKDGTKVSPKYVESILQSIPIIRNAVVTTTNDLTINALLTLESRMLRRWAHQQGRGSEDYEELCVDPDVYEWVKDEINRINAQLRPSENIRKFAILPVSFSPESGELTHTFKVRRRFVIDKYRPVLMRLKDREEQV